MSIEFKSIDVEERANSKVVKVSISGKLAAEDYEIFVPELERLIAQHGKIAILLELLDFHGWTAGALWEDIKFDVLHFNDIERLAIVGDSKWEKGMAAFCKPFTTADIRYFDASEKDKAEAWIDDEHVQSE